MEIRPHRIIKRKKTRKIKVGSIYVGGDAPVSVQSMTNTLTTDYKATIKTCHATVGKAILNTSVTIVFGFSILVLSKFIPTIYFGIFTGLAMLLAMVSVLTLLLIRVL